MKTRVFLRRDEVKLRLTKRNHSVAWLASQLSVSVSYMSDLMCARRTVAPKKRARVASLLSWRGKKWDDLFFMQFYTDTTDPLLEDPGDPVI